MKKIVALALSLVMVLGLATTAFAYENGDMFYDALTDEIANEYTYVEATDYVPGADNVLAYLTDGTDNYYIVTSKGTPLYVDGKKVDIQLGEVIEDLTEITYNFKAEAVKASKWSCKTDRHAAGWSYVDVDELTYYAVKAADPEDPAFVLLVGDKLIPADEDATYLPGSHVLSAKKDADGLVAPKEVGVGVFEAYCVACKQTVKISKDNINGAGYLYEVPADMLTVLADAQVSVALPAGYGLVPGPYYIVDAAPSVDAADKVESAQTFDAGIAMYVGMSLMAAAGSAVVLKKKD